MLFAVGSTLVNCTNSYDVEKPDPQMVELAKYAKQHVPEEHPKVINADRIVMLVKNELIVIINSGLFKFFANLFIIQ